MSAEPAEVTAARRVITEWERRRRDEAIKHSRKFVQTALAATEEWKFECEQAENLLCGADYTDFFRDGTCSGLVAKLRIRLRRLDW